MCIRDRQKAIIAQERSRIMKLSGDEVLNEIAFQLYMLRRDLWDIEQAIGSR